MRGEICFVLGIHSLGASCHSDIETAVRRGWYSSLELVPLASFSESIDSEGLNVSILDNKECILTFQAL